MYIPMRLEIESNFCDQMSSEVKAISVIIYIKGELGMLEKRSLNTFYQLMKLQPTQLSSFIGQDKPN